MRVRSNTSRFGRKTVWIEGVTTESETEVVDFALAAARETRGSVTGIQVFNAMESDGVMIVDILTD